MNRSASASPSSVVTGRLTAQTIPNAETGSDASALVCLLDRARDGDAARIRMLDDRARRQRELAEQQTGRREVEQVDQRELFPVEVLDPREQMHTRSLLRVVGASLMGVLAVAEVRHLREGGDESLRKRLDVSEPIRDR